MIKTIFNRDFIFNKRLSKPTKKYFEAKMSRKVKKVTYHLAFFWWFSMKAFRRPLWTFSGFRTLFKMVLITFLSLPFLTSRDKIDAIRKDLVKIGFGESSMIFKLFPSLFYPIESQRIISYKNKNMSFILKN